ncbi:MAG: UDP-glucose/GDP-mannose dehydrogenase family protein [Chloroflexi bacterium]|nr:UDP-glucose/GDP-mannose dehydrogenase family protein [Chloroflexota bacterium]
MGVGPTLSSTETVCVYGLWHLGCVTAACLASAGRRVVGLDPDQKVVDGLRVGQTPVAEPGLAELIQAGQSVGSLAFTNDAPEALRSASILWVTFDTPVDEADHADVAWVRGQLDAVRAHVQPHTLILISSQVPVGFSDELARDWTEKCPSLTFACSPENLRLGRAIEAFTRPDRVIVGCAPDTVRERIQSLFAPFCDRIEWMSLESAEMTKHAINAFLAASVVFANELARICEQVGADARDVERGLKSEARIGPQAYVAPGAPLAGGTLARDVAFLRRLSVEHHLDTPLFDAIPRSNRVHRKWAQARLAELLEGLTNPRVALLGLTYKPGTDTLRRSSSIELADWLVSSGVEVVAFDPAIAELPAAYAHISLRSQTDAALEGADAIVLATPWPEFASLSADTIVARARRAAVVDQGGFVAHLSADQRVNYVRLGLPR